MPDVAQNAANKLVEFLDEQAGTYLRGALHYTSEDYSVLFLRDDIEDKYSTEELEGMCRYWRWRNNNRGNNPFSLGNQHCTVEFYDGALMFHFTQSEDVGTVITLDPEAGRDIVTFITRCLKHLHQHSPQTIDNAPTWLQK